MESKYCILRIYAANSRTKAEPSLLRLSCVAMSSIIYLSCRVPAARTADVPSLLGQRKHGLRGRLAPRYHFISGYTAKVAGTEARAARAMDAGLRPPSLWDPHIGGPWWARLGVKPLQKELVCCSQRGEPHDVSPSRWQHVSKLARWA